MLFIFLFLLFGGAAYGVGRLASAFTAGGIAVLTLLTFVLIGASWVNDQTGISAMMINSWQFISGANTPGQVVSDCDNYGGIWQLLVLVLLLVVALVNMLFGVGAVIGIPLGIFVSMAGGVASLPKQTEEARQTFVWGLRILTVGLGCMIVAGLLMRLIHTVSAAVLC